MPPLVLIMLLGGLWTFFAAVWGLRPVPSTACACAVVAVTEGVLWAGIWSGVVAWVGRIALHDALMQGGIVGLVWTGTVLYSLARYRLQTPPITRRARRRPPS
jgi:hypothetical protein